MDMETKTISNMGAKRTITTNMGAQIAMRKTTTMMTTICGDDYSYCVEIEVDYLNSWKLKEWKRIIPQRLSVFYALCLSTILCIPGSNGAFDIGTGHGILILGLVCVWFSGLEGTFKHSEVYGYF